MRKILILLVIILFAFACKKSKKDSPSVQSVATSINFKFESNYKMVVYVGTADSDTVCFHLNGSITETEFNQTYPAIFNSSGSTISIGIDSLQWGKGILTYLINYPTNYGYIAATASKTSFLLTLPDSYFSTKYGNITAILTPIQ